MHSKNNLSKSEIGGILLFLTLIFLILKLSLHSDWNGIAEAIPVCANERIAPCTKVINTTKLFERISFETAPLWRIVALIITVFFMYKSTLYIDKKTKGLMTKWWSTSGVNDSKHTSWSDILTMISQNEESDPLTAQEKISTQLSPITEATNFHIPMLIISATLATAIDYIIFPRIPSYLRSDSHINSAVNISNNLTAYLALLAAAISIYFTKNQLVSKVRSDARMEWINEVRRLLSEIIADIIKIGAGEYVFLHQFNKNRLKMELMLNPSEKEHRLVSLLIRKCYIPSLDLGADLNVTREIKKEHDKNTDKYKNDKIIKSLMNILESENLDRDDIRDAVTIIIALSHILLKREWERVRYIR